MHGFHLLSVSERQQWVRAQSGESCANSLFGDKIFSVEDADRMIENAVGIFPLPLGIVPSLVVDGQSKIIPMVTEEASVVAAVNKASKIFNASGGVCTNVMQPVSIGQLLFTSLDASFDFESKVEVLKRESEALLEIANRTDPVLVEKGGGAFFIELKLLSPHSMYSDLNSTEVYFVVQLHVRTSSSMGANAINTMCEALRSPISALLSSQCILCILSNDGRGRLTHASVSLLFKEISRILDCDGSVISNNIQRASIFSQCDPFRAVTHNKGILNGVEAVLLAFGQDTRAVTASAMAYSACGCHETAPLSTWRVSGDALVGELELPLPIGTVGGARPKHRSVEAMYTLACVQTYGELAGLVAATGLAQNFAALLALITTGIQAGHMKLHLRK